MKVLVIGSGGREHAIAYKLKQSPKVTELYAIPGNPGIASLGTCVPGSVEDNEFIVDFIKKNQIDLTVIGPEVPLCKGLADDIEKAGYKAFGPQKKAATLEGSKATLKILWSDIIFLQQNMLKSQTLKKLVKKLITLIFH